MSPNPMSFLLYLEFVFFLPSSFSSSLFVIYSLSPLYLLLLLAFLSLILYCFGLANYKVAATQVRPEDTVLQRLLVFPQHPEKKTNY